MNNSNQMELLKIYHNNEYYEEIIDRFIREYISPTGRSNEKRSSIVNFIRELISTSIPNGYIIEVGSSSLRSYLPESDLDLLFICPISHSTLDDDIHSECKASSQRQEMKLLTTIFNAWCNEISDKDDGISKYSDMMIRNVEFVNARTKLAHCLVNNVSVDVTVNQISSLISVIFLEEVDRFIGNNHLFKRSLLLIKNWCLHESKTYCGISIVGAKSGTLSSYALSIMVLYVFNRYPASHLSDPLSILRYFLFTYMQFQWDTHILTLNQGAVAIGFSAGGYNSQVNSIPVATNTNLSNSGTIIKKTKSSNTVNINGSSGKSSSTLQTTLDINSSEAAVAGIHRQTQVQYSSCHSNLFENILKKLLKHPSIIYYQSFNKNNKFVLKSCNIKDPIDCYNNLGMSVSRSSLVTITRAFANGFQHLEAILKNFVLSSDSKSFNYPNNQATTTADNHNNNNNINSHSSSGGGGGSINVSKLLQPVNPSNLGYVGTMQTISSVPISNTIAIPSNTYSENNSSFYPQINRNVPDYDNINYRNTNIATCGGHGTIPRRNSKTNSRTNILQSGPIIQGQATGISDLSIFLRDYFPLSLSLYRAIDTGDALRSDLLNHPLQPLHSGITASSLNMTSQIFRMAPNTMASAVDSSLDENAVITAVSQIAPEGNSKGLTHSNHRLVKSNQYNNINIILGNNTDTYSICSDSTDAATCSGSEFSGVGLPGIVASAAATVTVAVPQEDDYLMGDLEKMYEVLDWYLYYQQNYHSIQSKKEEQEKIKTSSVIAKVRSSSNIAIDIVSETSVVDSVMSCVGNNSTDVISETNRNSLAADNFGDIISPSEETQQLLKILTTTNNNNNPIATTIVHEDDIINGNTPLLVVSSITDSTEGKISTDRTTIENDLSSEDSSAGQCITKILVLAEEEDEMAEVEPAPPCSPANSFTSNGTAIELSSSSSTSKSSIIYHSELECDENSNCNNSVLSDEQHQEQGDLNDDILQQSHHSLGEYTHMTDEDTDRKEIIGIIAECQQDFDVIKNKYTPSKNHINRSFTGSSIGGVPNSSSEYKNLKGKNKIKSKKPSHQQQQYQIKSKKPSHQQQQYQSHKSENIWSQSLNLLYNSWFVISITSIAAFIQRHILLNLWNIRKSSLFVALAYSISIVLICHYTCNETAYQYLSENLYNNKHIFHRHKESVGINNILNNINNIKDASISNNNNWSIPIPIKHINNNISSSYSILSMMNPIAHTLATHWVRRGDSLTIGQMDPLLQMIQSAQSSHYYDLLNDTHISYQWTRNDVNITNPSVSTTTASWQYSSGWYNVGMTYYTIKKIAFADEGHYKCYRYIHRKNILISLEAMLEAIIQISREPKVFNRPSYQNVRIGGSIIINIEVDASTIPRPDYQWYRNGYPIDGMTQQNLVIHQVNETHSGTYSCNVQNIAGSVIWLESTVLIIPP